MISTTTTPLSHTLTLDEEYPLTQPRTVRTHAHSPQIQAWTSRNCALTTQEFNDMWELRHYDVTRLSQCFEHINGIDAALQDQRWYQVFTEIMQGDYLHTPYDAGLGLLNAISPFLAYAGDALARLLHQCPMVGDSDAVLQSLTQGLTFRLQGIALKTIVLELNRERLDGHLEGSSPQDRQQSFIRLCVEGGYRTAFYNRYPVLSRFLCTAVDDYIGFIGEFLTRIEDCDERLRNYLGITEPLSLDGIAVDSGDCHDHGRCVMIVSFNGIKTAYKPRNLNIHNLFYEVVRECEKSPDFLPLHITKALCTTDYAFERFVETADCDDEEQVKRYFQRFGQILSLVWFMHGNDMHYENIIPSGEFPQIVDYETIATGSVDMSNASTDAERKVQSSIRDSLAGSALLPTRRTLNVQGESLDLSALDPHDQSITSPTPVPVDMDADDAHFEKRKVSFSKQGHVVHLCGQAVDPMQYREQILSGFDCGVRALAHIDRDMVRTMLAAPEYRVRVLVRSTNDYARFLEFIHHPAALDDMKRIDAILENLYVFPYTNKGIFLSEYRQLIGGDVPMFQASLNSLSITDPDGTTITPVFKQTIADRIMHTADHLADEARFQRRIICNALHLHYVCNGPANTESFSLERYPQAVMDSLIHESVLGDDGSISWVTALRTDLQSSDDATASSSQQYVDFTVTTPPTELYQGIGGTTVFLAAMAKNLPNPTYQDYAQRCLHSLLKHATPSASSSGFTGGTSRLYAALSMYRQGIERVQARKYITTCINYLPTYIDTDFKKLTEGASLDAGFATDYLAGACSIITLYLSSYDMLGDQEILFQLSRLGHAIMQQVKPLWEHIAPEDADTYPSGAAHGMEGMAFSFWQLYTATHNPEFASFARELWEHAMERRATQQEHSDIKWCRGEIGVLWAQNELESIRPEQEGFFIDGLVKPFPTQQSIDQLIEQANWTNDTLCHGRCGAIDTLVSIATARHDEHYMTMARHLMGDMIDQAQHRGGFLFGPTPEFIDLSVFLGPTGIAYTMLRLRNPSLPSLLPLEIQ
jgi:type 2 lantibiotic biosynthesis protein LanM